MSFLGSAFLLILLQSGCRTTTTDGDGASLAVEGVARDLAALRAAQISDLRYRLSLNLSPGAERLEGQQEIRLRLSGRPDPLVLDFRDIDPNQGVIDGTLRSVSVNGTPVRDLRQANGHILIPGRHFAAGENSISLGFESGIAPANRPITRYLDRDDGSEYIYTLFVPMDASLAFPCFDQPDLKARFTLDITAPDSWTVVSNAAPEKVDGTGREGLRRTYFGETRPISSYLFAFAAGPFQVIDAGGADIPMRLLVRRSKLQRAQEEAAEIIRVTQEGIRHLTEFFAHPFPFPKYDSVLIPGFAYGGMEHAGATFFREESLVFRTVPTEGDKLGRATLLLHELAHQWFGDLVTMRWFDDLWLKEGFATYMAYRTLARLANPEEIWKRFYLSLKPAAYGIDATRGTTPIYQEVRNLKDAKSAYGAIVYSKAPGLLRYLSFVIGEPAFREGVRLFLREHAYANADWNELIRAFERSSKQSLGHWASAWVRQRGMPKVEVEWGCDTKDTIDRFTLRQRDALGEGSLWPVKTQLLLADREGKSPASIEAGFDAAQVEVREAIGKKCPVYVFGNFQDYSYGLYLLDSRSRAGVSGRLGEVRDPFLRALLWGALWDSVREAEMPPAEFISLALKLLPGEKDEELTQAILGRVTTAYQRYLSPAQQSSAIPKIEEVCFDRMLNAADRGLRITYFRTFRSMAETPGARDRIKALLAGGLVVPGVEIKPLDRWRMISALLAHRDGEAERLLAAERKKDTSDDGRKYAYVTEAARAEAGTKRRYFDEYLENRSVPEDWVEGSLASFNSWNQSALTFQYLKRALAALPRVKRERKIFFVLAWLNAFIGGQQSREALDLVLEFLRETELDRDLELKVLEVVDELERTVRIRSKFGA